MIYFKRIKSLHGYIVILCDDNLIGKTIESGDLKFEINNFYKGEPIDEEKITADLLKDAIMIHAIGDKSIGILERLNIIDKGEIKYINKVPIVMVFYVQ